MDKKLDLSPLKQIPILEVAQRLGIQVRGTKAMCFMGHDKASPSLSFSRLHNTWRCFGACGKNGDAITLVMEKDGLDFNAALEWLSNNFNVEVKRRFNSRNNRSLVKSQKNPVVTMSKESEFISDSELYTWFIDKCAVVSGSVGLNYLHVHGISAEAATRFNIRQISRPGYALRKLVEKWGEQRVYRSGMAWGSEGKPERLIWASYALLFPFYEEGKVVYIQARMFNGKQKFLNLRGITKPLFNVDRLKSLTAGQTVHLCEGVPDVVSLESNCLYALGVLGATSFRVEWVDRFLKFKVVILGDGDDGGAKFAQDISMYFMDRGKPVQCMTLPKGKDVADVLVHGRTK